MIDNTTSCGIKLRASPISFRIAAKRKELQDKIDDLKKRPFGRNIVNNPDLGSKSRKARGFNTAARNAQIEMLQKQIDELYKTQ
ncbi:hypothetical protein [Desulfobacterium sp. N47]|uniref:hypothetical protein n=1 Tax=Desulfobacterium sp. N47 TaxID=3115210 RepID=UPI003CA280E6